MIPAELFSIGSVAKPIVRQVKGELMLFETRESVAEVSPDLVAARDALFSGDSREAWRRASEYRQLSRRTPGKGLATANDFVLCMEIARACSVNKSYLALARMSIAAFPNDPNCQLYYARALLTRGLHNDGLEYLHALESSLGQSNPGLWAVALANMYADVGFAESCDRHMERAASETVFDSAVALYGRASAMESLQRWDKAIDLSRRCVEAAPRWVRARTLLIHCLLTRSKVDEAIEQWEAATASGVQDASIDLIGGMLAFSLGDFQLSRKRFESFLADWPQADSRNWAERCLAILLVENGDNAAARAVIGSDSSRLALPEIPELPSGKPHKFIPLPILAQKKDQCLPTTVAMAAYPQGTALNPDKLFREMKGREGTAMWRAWDWVKEHGFQPQGIRPEKEAAIAMINVGVPLIGTIFGPFHSHVEVITGYNEDLDVAYVRDPAHWAPMAWPWDMLLQRYELNNGLLAVIDRDNSRGIHTAAKFRSGDYVAIVDIERAVASGRREEAEAASGLISDDSPAAYMRDSEGVRVTISPMQYRERLEHWAARKDANPIARFRALMNLGSDKAKQLLDELQSDSNDEYGKAALGSGAIDFLRLITAMTDGEWDLAQRLNERLLRRNCGVAAFWEFKSDIESELGNPGASLDALSKAIELEPLRMMLREKWLQRNVHSLTFNEYLGEFEHLLADDPNDKYLLRGRASALLDGPDGKAFEEASRECMRWFPRDPSAYGQLMQWYDSQGRSDLSDATLKEARSLMPDIYPDAEEDYQPDASGIDPSTSAGSDSDLEVTADSQLPDEKDQLLALIWATGDPRRDRALKQAVKLASEHRLSWYEHTRVVAARVLVPESDVDGTPAVKPEECLPSEFSGAAHWFAEAVADTVTDFNNVLEIAHAVLNWIDRIVPEYEVYPSLWLQRVLLLENAREKERALVELKKILKRYPANSSALYRMAIVKYQQQDYRSSLKYTEESLRVNPGLQGSLQLRRRVLEILDMQAELAESVRLLRQKFPYHFDYFREQVLSESNAKKSDEVIAGVHQLADDFPPERVSLLVARLHIDDGNIAEAQKRWEQVDIESSVEDVVFEDYLEIGFALSEAKNKVAEKVALCDAGLERWPNSTRLKEIKAGCVALTDPNEASVLLRQTILDGEPSSATVWQYLSLIPSPAGQACVELVNACDESKRESVMDLCDDSLAQPSLTQFRKAFLQAMLERYPDSNQLLWKLAGHCHLAGEVRLSIKYAMELHEREPEEPEAGRMLGRVLIDKDPKRALTYLETACKKNRSVDYLFDLARCHQIVGNGARAKALHWEILRQNPFVAASWTNLSVFGEAHSKLWPLLEPILRSGNCLHDEYFLVAAVKMSIALRRTLPLEWFPVAVERSQLLRTHTGYGEEKRELRMAILAWLAVRPSDSEGWSGLPKGWLWKLWARFQWPRTNWVPKPEPNAAPQSKANS